MSWQVIEGTWEEIERRKAELIGRQLRVTIKPDTPALSDPGQVVQHANDEPPVRRRVSAMGKYAGILSTADFLRQKQEEIDLEDRAHK